MEDDENNELTLSRRMKYGRTWWRWVFFLFFFFFKLVAAMMGGWKGRGCDERRWMKMNRGSRVTSNQ